MCFSQKTEQPNNLREHPLPGPMSDGNMVPQSRHARPDVYTIQVQEGSVKSSRDGHAMILAGGPATGQSNLGAPF